MSQPTPPSSEADPPLGDPPHLTHHYRDGRRYVRRPEVRDEIRQVLAAGPDTWDAPHLRSETLVHLVRKFRGSADSMATYTKLVDQLGRRVARIVGDNSKGIDPPTRDELIDSILNRVIVLILSPTQPKKGEYLEVSFRKVVQGLALNAVDAVFLRREECPVVGLVDDYGDEDRDGQDPRVTVTDGRPPPDELAQLAETRRLVQGSLEAITDPRHREAFLLRYGRDWPLTDQDPTVPTLCNRFKRKERQIRNWLQIALDQMRESLGENL